MKSTGLLFSAKIISAADSDAGAFAQFKTIAGEALAERKVPSAATSQPIASSTLQSYQPALSFSNERATLSPHLGVFAQQLASLPSSPLIDPDLRERVYSTAFV
jgi:hypothetical protein